MTLNVDLAVEIPSLETEFREPLHCFRNVRKQVLAKGGRAVFGWQRGLVAFAAIQTWVHHCVWQSPEGQLFDLTPGLDGFFNATSIFIPDENAQLIQCEDGRYRALAPEYTALTDSPKVPQGIQYLMRADQKLRSGDVRGEAYWCQRIAALFGGWMTPHGENGLRTMTPFVF